MPNIGTVTITSLADNSFYEIPIDTSFEPYRREAQRIRSIPAQRDAIALDNIPGEGTVNTEALWRRGQQDWSGGAGQYSLDRKNDEQPNRFLASLGADVFSHPYEASLLPVMQLAHGITGDPPAQAILWNGYFIIVTEAKALLILNATTFASVAPVWGTVGSLNTGAPTSFVSVCSNTAAVFIATDKGIIYATSTGFTFELYSATDLTTSDAAMYGSLQSTPYSTFSLVRWANDQLIAAAGPRLYAFQPRTNTATGGGTPIASGPVVSNAAGTIVSGMVGDFSAEMEFISPVPHNLTAGQVITVENSYSTPTVSSVSLSGHTMTINTGSDVHGFSVNDRVTVKLTFTGIPNGRSEHARVLTVPSNFSFTYTTSKFGDAAIDTGFLLGECVGAPGTGVNGQFTVAGTQSISGGLPITSATHFEVAPPSGVAFPTVVAGGQFTCNYPPDMLFTHSDPNWVWVDAAGGATQVYFAGHNGNAQGTVYRSDMLGSTTSNATNLQLISSAQVTQPWMLDTPIQALPMAAGEYPTSLLAYLNYIFVGTNYGIRMCQTLSIYDPTATSTGDLKAGPYLPNLLQPIYPWPGTSSTAGSPVVAMAGWGRYVYFTWTGLTLLDPNVAASSNLSSGRAFCGVGKVDIARFINQDPLAPSYATDLMAAIGAQGGGIENCAVVGVIPTASIIAKGTNQVYLVVGGPNSAGTTIPGIYSMPNVGASVAPTLVTDAYIASGIIDYGLPEPKIPFTLDVDVRAGGTGTTTAMLFYNPNSAGEGVTTESQTITLTSQGGGFLASPIPVNSTYASFRDAVVSIKLGASANYLRHWNLHSWPCVVQPDEISAVLQLYRVSQIDGLDVAYVPYKIYTWLQDLRYAQTPVTYQEGPLSATALIVALDWIPHEADGTYETGFQGDCVLSLKTVGNFTYTAPAT